jgi:hypothetical protein
MDRQAALNFEDFDGGQMKSSHPPAHSGRRRVPSVPENSLEMIQFEAGLVAQALVQLAVSYGERRNRFLIELRSALTKEDTSKS